MLNWCHSSNELLTFSNIMCIGELNSRNRRRKRGLQGKDIEAQDYAKSNKCFHRVFLAILSLPIKIFCQAISFPVKSGALIIGALMKLIIFVLLLLSNSLMASPPFAKGQNGDLKWELRFNLPVCDHAGQKKGAWCTSKDKSASVEYSGVEKRLRSWISNEKIKSIYLAYFSFSNTRMRQSLCYAAENRGLKVTIFINESNLESPNVIKLRNCSKNIKVIGKGKGPFGTKGAHLMHMKIFMASFTETIKPFHKYSDREKAELQNTPLYFTSSSANMSSNGTGLHFENWLFFNTKLSSHLAQQNICIFTALMAKNDRRVFAENYKACARSIESKPRSDLKFFVVPNLKMEKPYKAMMAMLKNAKKEVLVAIHRLTTKNVYGPLKAAAQRVKVRVIFDDDTLRAGVVDGGVYKGPGYHDVLAYRALRKQAEVSFVETNASEIFTHMFHNKFIVTDREFVFQGAGNFTGAALNINKTGNYEQFYVIRIPEIADAYTRGWMELRRRATLRKDHPIGQNKDK